MKHTSGQVGCGAGLSQHGGRGTMGITWRHPLATVARQAALDAGPETCKNGSLHKNRYIINPFSIQPPITYFKEICIRWRNNRWVIGVIYIYVYVDQLLVIFGNYFNFNLILLKATCQFLTSLRQVKSSHYYVIFSRSVQIYLLVFN